MNGDTLMITDIFDFRPHCGESGDVDNLAAGIFL